MNDSGNKENSLIAGRYRIESPLGKGGSGVVYRAQDTVLKRYVAIKTINKNLLSDKDLVRFQSEAKAMAKVNHRNVVDIYDFGIAEDGDPYLVMEFAAGKTLNQHIEENDNLDFEESLDIAVQILNGLKAIHEARLIHRDLKPENIMIENSDGFVQAKLLDFGIARQLNLDDENYNTRPGATKGSPLYMSPEQIKGEPPGKQSDIYSTGCLLYYLLSGKPPFSGNTIFDIMQAHLKNDIPELNHPDAPPDLKELIKNMMAKDQQKRPLEIDSVLDNISKLRDQLEEKVNDSDLESSSDNPGKRPPSLKFIVASLSLFALMTSLITLAVWRLFSNTDTNPKTSFHAPVQENRLEMSFVYLTADCDKELESLIKGNATDVATVIIASEISHQSLKNLLKLRPRYLGVLNSNLDEESFKIISQQPSIKDIRVFDNPQVTASSISHLKNLNLLGLALRKCGLTDSCLEEVTKLDSLMALDLEENEKVTANGLKQIAKLKKLKLLYLFGCSFKSSDIAQLRTKLNQTKIFLVHTSDTSKFMKKLQAITENGESSLIPIDISRIYISNSRFESSD